ncbi:hypothetical protein [Kitasatospora aureofaciens]|uniref:hypothetical protein n=1 Tax=Kitasatospora aureofaciens TaxID=1894 RepID=UPI001C46E41F|nr:hypothetical protein [Kitasatospora aureofaciens]MBV6698083.1 hypothetical protein [Kitasatospora aureofaciens]
METTTTDTPVTEPAWPEYIDLELLLNDPDLLATAAPMPTRSLDFGHAGGCG